MKEYSLDNRKDMIVDSVRNDLLNRSSIGQEKYGITLDRDDLSELEWLQHAYEECLDQSLYLKKLITIKTNKN